MDESGVSNNLTALHVGMEIVRMLGRADVNIVEALRRSLGGVGAAEITSLIRKIRFSFEALDEDDSETAELQKLVSESLADIIQAGILDAGTELFKEFSRGSASNTTVRATLLGDGRIQFEGEFFTSPSTAAIAAIRAAEGKKPASRDGWAFWKFRGVDGRTRSLHDARQEFRLKAGR